MVLNKFTGFPVGVIKYSPDGTQLWFDTFNQNSGFHTPTSMEFLINQTTLSLQVAGA